jgi:hypothetical protein
MAGQAEPDLGLDRVALDVAQRHDGMSIVHRGGIERSLPVGADVTEARVEPSREVRGDAGHHRAQRMFFWGKCAEMEVIVHQHVARDPNPEPLGPIDQQRHEHRLAPVVAQDEPSVGGSLRDMVLNARNDLSAPSGHAIIIRPNPTSIGFCEKTPPPAVAG